MNEKREKQKKSSYVGIVLNGVLAALLGIVMYFICRICYIPEGIIWLPVIIVMAVVLFSRKNKRIAIGIVPTFLIIVLLSDGLLRGDKLEFKGILIRGAESLLLDERIPVLGTLGAKLFPTTGYNDDGTRISTYKAPEGYRYTQFMNDDVPYEYLEKETGSENVVLYLHGGAYIQRMSSTYETIMDAYTSIYDINVLVPDYRIPPENPYPTDLKDVYEAYLWLLDKGYKPENIIISGDSAGGGLALALGLYLKDNGQPMPAGFITFSAWTDLRKREVDYTENKSVETLFKHNDTISEGIDNYLADGALATDVYVSPVLGDYTGFPPMLLQVGNYEILKVNTTDVYESAMEAGVDVTMEAYPGMYHDFQLMKGTLKVADDAWVSVKEFLTTRLQ